MLNQLLENSKLLDNRLAEEDFPLSEKFKENHEKDINKEDLLLLDIPFMLTSFLLSQVSDEN